MNYNLINSLDEFDALTEEWNRLLSKSTADIPFLRHEYLRAWWELRGGGEWPDSELALVTARRDGHLAGIAPLFYTPKHDGLPALMLLGSIEISDYLDVIAPAEDLPAFLPGLLDFLVNTTEIPEWRALDWYNLPESSPTVQLLADESRRRDWQFEQVQLKHTPTVPLPGDFEAYLAGIDKKQRHEIRRKIRRAEGSGRAVRWYIVTDESRLDTEIEAFLGLMSQDPAKQEFLTQTMCSQMRALMHAAFRAGWLQLAFLEVDGEKAAGYLNFDYGNHIWVYNSGLDRRFMDVSPGWVLLGYLLQWANENQRSEFDFMRGNEEYKYRFGAVDRFIVRARALR
ncbi:MAG: GNAT family N-acetyltransferase [Chloroflexota bacterium]